MKKLKLIFVLIAFVFLLGGCAPLFMKKDQLIVVSDAQTGSNTGTLTARAKVEKYEQLFSGSLLAYNQFTGTAVLTDKIKKTDNSYTSELAVYKNGQISPLFSVSTTITEARIDTASGDIYIKERDPETNKSALYWTTGTGDTKVRLTEDVYEKYLAWNLTRDSLLIYVDNDNRIIMGNQSEQLSVYNLPKSYIVKKIAYAADENFVLILAATSQTENVLYRLNLDGEKQLSAIDVNVTDFVVSQAKRITAYIKTNSSGLEQLYVYDHASYIRQYLCSNNIEKISFSPQGNFIAFATKVTAEIPTQSVWIIKYNNDIPVQLTANTKLSGNIYWTSDELGILFTTSDVSADSSDTEPSYKTYLLKFSFEYFDSSYNETGDDNE